MSMLHHLVVVSVSAAIAGGNTPAVALNSAETTISQTIPDVNQLQHHLSSGNALPTVGSDEKNVKSHEGEETSENPEPSSIALNPHTSFTSPSGTARKEKKERPAIALNSHTSLTSQSGTTRQEKKEHPAIALHSHAFLTGQSSPASSQNRLVLTPHSPQSAVEPPSAAANVPIAPPESPSNVANSQNQPPSERIAQQRVPTQSIERNTQNSPILPRRQTVPIPEYLRVNPNPLQFPTRPEEVNIEATQPLTLLEAIELARGNNRDLQEARLTLERSRAALREARAALYPTLDLQADLVGSQSSGGERQIEAQRQAQRDVPRELRQDIPDQEVTTSLSGALAFSYDIFTGGRRSAQIRAAEEQARINQLDVERLSEQTRLDVATAYYDLQQADEAVRIAESAVRNATRSLQDAQALFEAGLGTRFDVLRAQVNLANNNQELIRARAEQRTRRRDLARLLSLPQSINVVAADPVEIAGLWDLSLEQSIVQAFQNRAELQQQIAQRNLSRQLRQAELAARKPQVSLFFNYNLEDIFNDGLGLADGYSAGARLRWNLFDGGAAHARADQRRVDQEIAETRFANQRNQIRFQVEQSYFTLQSNLENIQTASVALEQAREALRLARLRFQAGVGTQTEVIDAENDLIEAEGNRVRAILDYNRALATLIRSISNLPVATP